jgi:hypothetical protein
MTVNYVIEANVIDIQNDSPTSKDAFLVDSNVWYWMTYTKASLTTEPWARSRIAEYSFFVNKAISADSKLYRCGLSLAELSHIIEKSEREIFEKTSGTIRPKEYRHNYPTERQNVVTEVEAAWGQVKTMATSIDIMIDDVLADHALPRFAKECVDGYDLFILEAMSSKKVIQVITDDGGFATVVGIQVFTANKNVLGAARKQNKLITR